MKTIRIPKADAELWLAALRLQENQARQGLGMLFNANTPEEGGGGYCCLGVGQCVVEGGRVEEDSLPSLKWLDSRGGEFKASTGERTEDPYLPSLGCKAAFANDSGDYTFAQLADAIEAAMETY